MDRLPTLLLGASVRAAAGSCRRAGIPCQGADLFADEDTQRLASVERVRDYPAGFAAVAENVPPGNWMYTGGLENHPVLIDQISRRHRLWGNSGDIVSHVRDPVELHRRFHAAGLPTPTTSLTVPTNGFEKWISKPRRSCGGAHVEMASESSVSKRGEIYFQAYVEGSPVAAVFIGHGQAAQLLGVTRQLIGEPWTGGKRFQYAGSVGPMSLADEVQSQLLQVGNLLSGEFGLRGLFGVDGVLNAEGFWPVEVNPRYTASVEILERASGEPVMAWHAAAFDAGAVQIVPVEFEMGHTDSCHGKAIVFAESNARIERDFLDLVEKLNHGGDQPSIADIPHCGTAIGWGQPVCTVFASGKDESQVIERLQRRVFEVRTAIT